MSRTHKKDRSAHRSRPVEEKRTGEPLAAAPKGEGANATSGGPRVRQFFLLHLKPNRLPAATLRFTHTFGLGGISAVLFGLLALSGMLLTLVYEPSPERAYGSLLKLSTQYRFGGFVRAVHYFSANLLIGTTVLHLLRVFYTGAFHGERRTNWIFGVLLLFSVLGAAFTGYLLPWDQLSYWAVTVATGMLGYVPIIGEGLRSLARGGAEVSGDTLLMFYALHTAYVPITVMLLMGFHFWRVRKARGVVVPHPLGEAPPAHPEKVPATPHLIIRELATGLTAVAVVFLLSALLDAPLGAPADPGQSPNPAKSPWYFLGFQELQLHFHPLVSTVAAPLLLLLALIAVPFLRYRAPLQGPWFLTRAGRRSTLITAAVTVVATALLVALDDVLLRPGTGVPSMFGRGVLPLIGLLAAMGGLSKFRLSRTEAGTAETVQILFTLCFTAFAVLTAVALWFRGENMALMPPWGE